MAKDKTPKPEVPMVEETPVIEPSTSVVDPVPEEETFDEVPTVEETPVTDPVPDLEASTEVLTVEENDLIESFENFEETHDDEVKPLSNREAGRLLLEKHKG